MNSSNCRTIFATWRTERVLIDETVHMYICIFAYMCICVYMYVCLHVCACVCAYKYVCLCVSVYGYWTCEWGVNIRKRRSATKVDTTESIHSDTEWNTTRFQIFFGSSSSPKRSHVTASILCTSDKYSGWMQHSLWLLLLLVVAHRRRC